MDAAQRLREQRDASVHRTAGQEFVGDPGLAYMIPGAARSLWGGPYRLPLLWLHLPALGCPEGGLSPLIGRGGRRKSGVTGGSH